MGEDSCPATAVKLCYSLGGVHRVVRCACAKELLMWIGRLHHCTLCATFRDSGRSEECRRVGKSDAGADCRGRSVDFVSGVVAEALPTGCILCVAGEGDAVSKCFDVSHVFRDSRYASCTRASQLGRARGGYGCLSLAEFLAVQFTSVAGAQHDVDDVGTTGHILAVDAAKNKQRRIGCAGARFCASRGTLASETERVPMIAAVEE